MKISIDAAGVVGLTESYQALAVAVERCTEALKGLATVRHGGVEFVSANGLTKCTVKPFEG